MIDLKEMVPLNGTFDGQLKDGRFVEFKRQPPTRMDALMRKIVAMANSSGGVIIFGVDERGKIIGVHGDKNQYFCNIQRAIETLSLGILHILKYETINEKDIIILEIKKSESTAFFSRAKTSAARQYAYTLVGNTIEAPKEGRMLYEKVYKYMTLDAFLASLYSKTWRFFEPSKWNDKFEQRFYCARYILTGANYNPSQVFATCVTRVKNNEAAWKVYSHGQGLGIHCVQLELDVAQLRKQLRANMYNFEERTVTYKSEEFILKLHKKNNKNRNVYFSKFTLDSFLKLLSLKREAYSYEQEVRLFIIPKIVKKRNRGKKTQHEDIKIEWDKIINKVRVDKKCSDAELASIRQACFFVGINPIINNYVFIDHSPAPKGLKDVEFDMFDIDEMPGTGIITIS